MTLLEEQALKDEFAKSATLQEEFGNRVEDYVAYKKDELRQAQRYANSAFCRGVDEQNARGVPVKNVL